MSTKREMFYVVLCALLAFIFSFFYLRRINFPSLEDRPTLLGRQQGIEVYFHLGDVALPNKLNPDPIVKGRYSLSSRDIPWDTYMITAPVPEIKRAKDKTYLIIPWTSLPASVVRSVSSIDPNFAKELETRIGLKKDPSEWHFERIDEIEVPTNTDYHNICKIRYIYAVNMFDFLKDFQSDYKTTIRHAISNSVMEVVQRSGKNRDKGIAFPALAGAQYVIEKDIVLSYSDSFGAILDGISRVQGTKPSEVYLVVWRELIGHKECRAALKGLENALYKNLSSWKKQLKNLIVVSIGIFFIIGVAVASVHLKNTFTKPINFLLCLVAIFALVVGTKYTSFISDYFPASSFPRLSVSILSGVSFLLGMQLRRRQFI